MTETLLSFLLRLWQFLERLEDFFLGTGVVAGLGMDNLAVRGKNEGLRGEDNIHGPFEVVVHIEQAGEVRPATSLGECPCLCCETGVVGRDQDKLERNFFLPVIINFAYCIYFVDTRLSRD